MSVGDSWVRHLLSIYKRCTHGAAPAAKSLFVTILTWVHCFTFWQRAPKVLHPLHAHAKAPRSVPYTFNPEVSNEQN